MIFDNIISSQNNFETSTEIFIKKNIKNKNFNNFILKYDSNNDLTNFYFKEFKKKINKTKKLNLFVEDSLSISSNTNSINISFDAISKINLKKKNLIESEFSLTTNSDDSFKEEKITHKKINFNNLSCIICLENYILGDIVVINKNCQHNFHEFCILEWINNKKDSFCPLCKKKFSEIEE